MTTRTRARAAQAIEAGYGELRAWWRAWEAQASRAVEMYQRSLVAPPELRPTGRQYVDLAAAWVALPWAPLFGKLRIPLASDPARRPAVGHGVAYRAVSLEPPRVAHGAAGRFSDVVRTRSVDGVGPAVVERVVDAWASGLESWASALGCLEDDYLVFEFDEAAEMVGPARRSLPIAPQPPITVSDLTHVAGVAVIPKQHVVVRVVGAEIVVSLVDLLRLQPTLPFGHYRGDVTFGSGQVVSVFATKV